MNSTDTLPEEAIMYAALLEKDTAFEGIFVAAIKTTGIFCRPSCTARKPKKENVNYFASAQAALLHGYRPCKVCNPLNLQSTPPPWIRELLEEIKNNPGKRLRDADIRSKGTDPNRVRRWFKKHYGITFSAYLRTLNVNHAFTKIKKGEKVTSSAYDYGYESLSGFGDSFKKITGFSPIESRSKKIITITRITTPLGPMIAGVIDEGLCLLEFSDRRMLDTQLTRLKKLTGAELTDGTHPLLAETENQLRDYFEGKRTEFSLPLSTPGTTFQQDVWAVLQDIPYGKTRSYKEQAICLGNPGAVRAVAKANGDNRIAIIIPCHRVIGADGKPTGYGGGIWRKKKLLELEQQTNGHQVQLFDE